MSKPVLLLVAYYFPADDALGGARPFRFYKYLKRLGYECHVLTAAGNEGKGIAARQEAGKHSRGDHGRGSGEDIADI